MTRLLLTIFAAGLIIAAASFALTAGLGGYSWASGAEPDGPIVERDLHWAGARSLDVGDGLRVTFRQGPVASMVATGPKNQVDRLYVEGGKIKILKKRGRVKINGFPIYKWDHTNTGKIRIAVTAPDVASFEAHGGASMKIEGLKRSAARIVAHSGSSLRGDIEVDRLETEAHSGASLSLSGKATAIQGSAHSGASADLDGLRAVDGTVEVHSGASLSLAATGSVNATAHSGGGIELRGRPATLSQSESSGGSVDVEDAPAAPKADVRKG